ncbi:FAD-binding protein [Streptomyces sp. 8N706]|uniref:FAD-binding protein n=1 Tax=Streptomyces sp. 8N706 TaxID=3457416 RepID=UPI003FD6A0F0
MSSVTCFDNLFRPDGTVTAMSAVTASHTGGGRSARTQHAGGVVLDMTGLDHIHSINAERGEVVCDAGVTLHRLMEVLLPLGWFVPVVPGDRALTVGSAIGSDLHGRNQHADGSFTRHVRSMELLTADGGIRILTPDHTPEIFWATAGGLGLTGAVLSATVRLLPVETALMSVDTERLKDLDDLLSRLASTDHRYRYSAAWIDLLARGTATGRAVLTRGEHAPLDALPERARRAPPAVRQRRILPPLPFPPPLARCVPDGRLGRAAAGLCNELWYRKAPWSRSGELRRIPAFFHAHSGTPLWNRLYRPGDRVRYEFVVGHDRDDALRRIVRRVSRRGCPSLLAVLKRFGGGGPGRLSFAMGGWAVALDIPATLPGLPELLDELDEEVAAAGGRVRLTNGSRLRPELLAAMYPGLDAFRALRAELDPRGVFTSDLARRLGLQD